MTDVAATSEPETTAPADQDARTLPSTGRTSLPTGHVGSLLFTAGLALVRITRRRQA